MLQFENTYLFFLSLAISSFTSKTPTKEPTSIYYVSILLRPALIEMPIDILTQVRNMGLAQVFHQKTVNAFFVKVQKY